MIIKKHKEMNKQEIYRFTKENAAMIAREIISRGKDFQVYITDSGKIASKHVDGWETGAFTFGGYHLLIYRMPTLKHLVTAQLVIRQTYYDLFESGKGYLSPIEEMLEKAYYSEIEEAQ